MTRRYFLVRGIKAFVPISLVSGFLGMYASGGMPEQWSFALIAALVTMGAAVGTLGGALFGWMMWILAGKPDG